MDIREIYKDLTLAKYKKLFFFEKDVYEERYAISSSDIEKIESKHGIQLPSDFKEWWLLAGSCVVLNDSLLIGEREYMTKLENAGEMNGYMCLATDEQRNYYVCDPNKSEKIYFCDGHGQGYCLLADSFHDFLAKLKNHEYNIFNLIQNIELQAV